MPVIERLTATEILDSRGRPTVSATCMLAGGACASASVPSGASTGAAEALELRDRDPQRYGGFGCRNAVAHVSGEIHQALAGRSLADQAELDRALIELDATPNKSRLGANAILAVSVAFARASALERGVALYTHFAGMLGHPPDTLPRLTINLFSGGVHAGRQVAIQDVLIVPARPTTIDGSLAMAYDIYQAAAALVLKRYRMRLLTADEGGLAPPCESSEELIEIAMVAIKAAGYRPGSDVMLALDVAASQFYANRKYHLDGAALDSAGMIDRLVRWVERYPIVSVEDGLAEDDWDWWPTLRQALGKRALVVGDDLLCTNPQRIRRAIDARACSALLLKPNQIGTLTEAAEAWRLATEAGWQVTVSVRSGETEDNWIADLAVGWRGDQFKAGSITQSERLSKYNRLLAIEGETRWPVVSWRTGPANFSSPCGTLVPLDQ
jgi:enolase